MNQEFSIDRLADTRGMTEPFKLKLSELIGKIKNVIRFNNADNDTFDTMIRYFCASLVDSGKAPVLNDLNDLQEVIDQGTNFHARSKIESTYAEMLIQDVNDQLAQIDGYIDFIQESNGIEESEEINLLRQIKMVIVGISLNRLKRKQKEMETALQKITTDPGSEEARLSKMFGVFIEGDEASLRRGIESLGSAIKQLQPTEG